MTERQTEWQRHGPSRHTHTHKDLTERQTGCLRQSGLARCPQLIPEVTGLDPISTQWMAALERQRPPGRAAGPSLPLTQPAAESPAR